MNLEIMRSMCDEMLLALLGNVELQEKWWASQNKYFNNRTPNEVWLDKPTSVFGYLNSMCSGDYS